MYATIDSRLQELNYWFNEDAMELLRLSLALEPQEALKSFRSSDLCLLVKNFYPQDFIDYDKQVLEKEICERPRPRPVLWDVGPNPHEWVESCCCLSKWRFD